jgi:hypothetical protein
MTSPASRRARLRAVWLAGTAVALTFAVVMLAFIGRDQPGMGSGSPTPSAAAAAGAASAASPGPTPAVVCSEEPGDLALGLSKPACPQAILAIQLAVAPVRLPIDRIVIEPGPFFCDVLWPGVQTAAPCRGAVVQAGQFMHAWVRFRGSAKVAVVMLGLDLPIVPQSPRPIRQPWITTIVTVEIPPTGWVMP